MTKPVAPYHHGDLRRALLDAAFALIDAEGPGALTLRAVARAAGVSANAPYNHFADKGALLAAVSEQGLDLLHDAMRSAGEQAAGAGPALEAIGVAYVAFAAAHPARFRLFTATEIGKKTAHPSLVIAYERTFGVLLQAVRRAQDAGIVRKGDARRLALAAWSLVHGLATLLVEDQLAAVGFAEEDAMGPAAVRTLFRGLRE